MTNTINENLNFSSQKEPKIANGRYEYLEARSLLLKKVEAKLEVLNEILGQLQERRAELEKLKNDILEAQKEEAQRPKEGKQEPKEEKKFASEKQVRFCIKLARELGRQVDENALRTMSRPQISKMIEEFLKQSQKGGVTKQ